MKFLLALAFCCLAYFANANDQMRSCSLTSGKNIQAEITGFEEGHQMSPPSVTTRALRWLLETEPVPKADAEN